MPDRTINWGDSETEASYRTQDDDPAGGGNFVVVEDLDGGLIPLQYNPTTGKVETAVPIDTGSNDITTTGEVSAGTLEATGTFTDPAGNEYDGRVGKTTEQVQDDAIIWSDGYAPNFAGGSN